MVRVGRSAVAVAVASVGCSLITPLDFVGGTAGSSGGGGNQAGLGGSDGGRGGTAGTNAEGGTGEGAMGGSGVGGGVGGAGGAGGRGGESAEGGAAGDAGQAGEGGSTSAGTGGVGGRAGGGGSAGTAGGGTGGDTAGTAGGGGCAGADVGSDPMHCGTCGTVCGATEECLGGLCVDSPCDGLCATWVTVPLVGDGYRVDNIGTAEQCFEVVGYQRTMTTPALVCWNFAPERTLEINGVTSSCMTEPGVGLPDERVGGYCVKAGAGNHSYAGFKFPLP